MTEPVKWPTVRAWLESCVFAGREREAIEHGREANWDTRAECDQMEPRAVPSDRIPLYLFAVIDRAVQAEAGRLPKRQ